ncbi:MAG: hypothetical protein ACOYOK_12805 [Pseudobdellovibrionaceae bacterium]
MKKIITVLLMVSFAIATNAQSTRETGGMKDQMSLQYTCFNRIQLADGPAVAIMLSEVSGLHLRIHYGQSGVYRFVWLQQVEETSQSLSLTEKPIDPAFAPRNPPPKYDLKVVISKINPTATVSLNRVVYQCKHEI